MRCSAAEAIRAGWLLGAEAACTDQNPARALRRRLDRLFWRLQSSRVRRALVYGFVSGYRAEVRARATGAPVTHRAEE